MNQSDDIINQLNDTVNQSDAGIHPPINQMHVTPITNQYANQTS